MDKMGQSPLWDCEELTVLELAQRRERKIKLLIETLTSNADAARARRAASLREQENKKRLEQKSDGQSEATTIPDDTAPTSTAATESAS